APADPEQPRVARVRRRHKRLVADRAELALRPLQAERAVPARPRRVDQFHTPLGAVVVEHGADRVAFVLGVRVLRARELDPQRGERAQAVKAAAQLAAPLVHHDAHAFAGVFALMVVVVVVAFVVRMLVAGHAVARAVHARAHAQEPAIAHPRYAQRAAVGAHRAVGQGAARGGVGLFTFPGQLRGAFRVAGDVVVAGLAVQGVEV